MTNTFCVCLLFFCCANLSLARQVPKECTKGPEFWCQSLKIAADCGAVGHCIASVWEVQEEAIRSNEISDSVVRMFRSLKDVKDLINEEYLATRVTSQCRDIQYPAVSSICKENTAHLEKYLIHVLTSGTSPETMCKIVGLCNNLKIDNVITLHGKKTKETTKPKEKLIGSEKCTWGPSYWCSNFSTSHQCSATHHCVERVWSKQQLPVDTDSICKICTDMVTQARDQLESNETQEELREVFEGSCKLIPIKLVAKECMKVADDFVPELVETLASQMNPQQVCSVAGLCNNVKIDEMLEGYTNQLALRQECNNCQTTVGVLRKRFDLTSDDDFLVNMLKVCGDLGSFSDSCSMLVFKYYENIVEAVQHDFTPKNMCHMSAQCAYKYHQHDDYTFPEVKIEELKPTDDVPCEFCEQLVKHLRDVLIANTTEIEFQKILKGLCNQSGNFKKECLSIVEQYYELIYKYLVSNLKPAEICKQMGVCGHPKDVPVAPLVPKEIAIKAINDRTLIGTDEANSYKVGRVQISKQASVRIMGSDLSETVPQPLPIERMFVSLPQNREVCTFCQYFLHYLQVELSDMKNAEEIKEKIEQACDHLPQSLNAQCKEFVSNYGQAVVALLVQEFDPSVVCPRLGLCPKVEEVRKVAVNADKSNCPLCLFAVEQLETMLKNNRTETSIRTALDNLCSHLSSKLRTECVDFVDTYSQQLVEMLIANLNAQEICVYLKLCTNNTASTDPLKITHKGIDESHQSRTPLTGDRGRFRGQSLLRKEMLYKNHQGDIETNEIPDNTVNGRVVKEQLGQKPICIVCEFVMKEIDDQVKDRHNQDEIKKIVHGVCKRMPKSVKSDCDRFVEKYSEMVISLLEQELDPSEVCEELKLCDPSIKQQLTVKAIREEILDCAVCETVVIAVHKVLANDKVDRNIVHIVEKSCSLLPGKYHDRCHTMMEIYGDSIVHLIEEMGTKGVCKKIGMCPRHDAAYVHMHKAKRN